MEIDKKKLKRVKRRVLDEMGQVYQYEGKYIRIIKKSKTNFVKKMFASGLLDRLIEGGYLWPCKVSELFYEGCMVLESEAIVPHQSSASWTFEMQKAVGILILKVNEICYEYGYELLDAHQGNVMWFFCEPKYVDVGSIVKKRNSGNWIARREFFQAIYYPLYLWSKGYSQIALSLIANPRYRNDKEIKELYERFDESVEDKVLVEYEKTYPHSEKEVLEDIRYLEEKLKKMSYCNEQFWTNYQDCLWVGGMRDEVSERFQREIDFINEHEDIESMLELGSNQGYFSYKVATGTKIKQIIATDYDHGAVEKMFLRFREDIDVKRKILPLMVDFVNSPWEELQNYQSDLVVANALTHHLVFTMHVPLDCLVEELAMLTKRYIIVEFMPRGMANASRVPPWYNLSWFKAGICDYFDIIKIEEIEYGRIQIYGRKK